MKIGIEAQRIFRAKKHGMDVVAIELIKSLQEIDKHNEYVIYAAPGEDTSAIKETANFKVRLIKGFNYVHWEQILLPRRAAKDKIDFLHCTCNTAPLKSSVPKVVTIHDTIFVEEQKWPVNVNWYQKLGNYYRRVIVPQVASSCRKVITPTEFEKQNVINHFKIDASKINVVTHGVNDSFKKVTDSILLENVRKKYSLPDRFLFYLGNTEPRKNIHNLLKAYAGLIASHSAVPHLVITNVRDTFLQGILKQLDLEVLTDKIVLVGYVDSEDLKTLYSLAEIFLYPSLREGFGLPILEAMACGTPVVTSLASAMPEIAQDAALLADPFDYKQLGQAISALLMDDNLRKKLAMKGLERAQAFTWRAAAGKTLAIYESLAK